MTKSSTEPCVFFGSGPVAAVCLELLLQHHTVEAVVTKPRPAHHKGAVPVLEVAEKYSLPVHTATNRLELDSVITSVSFTSRYAILIDFGIIVSKNVIDSFELGIVNSHFSLLPKLRGADPITWSIANGDKTTGVSLMLIDEGMDTGTLIGQQSLHIAPDDTTPTLTDRLVQLSDAMLQEYIPRYVSGEISPRSQPHPDRATYSRKLTKADGIIDWNEPADYIERKIRAFTGWPQSRTALGDIECIITQAHTSDSQTALSVQCGDGMYLVIDSLKPLGKKEMPREAFLAGYRHRLN